MYIFLILWFIFLLGYIVFNVYGMTRVSAMRFPDDAVGRVLLVYIIAILIVITIAIIIIGRIDWSQSISAFFRK